ncbi:MAG: T9SS type A sorting domain-containing protein, partial [Flavobacteriales bacterium]|nr:T9SS type A sorting domain-containing protein [Flavobacteriales bacterium]
NETQMFVGTENGAVFHYDNIENNLTGPFNAVDTLVANINIGPNAAPALGDLNGDNFPDMIVGTKRGGVSLYMGNPDFISTFEELVADNIFKVYPNPTAGLLSVVNPFNSPIRYQVFSSIGRLVQSGEVRSLLDVSNLNSGMYFVLFEKEDVREVLRVMKD